MAKRSELLYWDVATSKWQNARYRYWNTTPTPDVWASYYTAVNGYDVNPVTAFHLSDAVGNARRGQITLINRPRKISSSTAGEQIGRFTDVFTDFQDVRVRDGENGSILLAGKIHNMDEKFDFRYGSSIVLYIIDHREYV